MTRKKSPRLRGTISRLNILQIVANLDIGGAQEVVATLAKHMAAAEHRPVVATLRDGPLRTDIEALGIEVEILPARKHSVLALPGFVGDMRRIRRDLAAIVDRHQIDVVQTHLLRSLDFLTATLRRRGRPLVYWTFHNSSFMLRREHLPGRGWLLKPKQFGYRWLYRLMSHRIDGFIAVSDEVRVSMVEHIGQIDDKITVIKNGVDVDRYGAAADRQIVRAELGIPSEAAVMVMVGTFKEQKGHVHLVEAATTVLPANPHARILLVGDGELRPEIERLVRTAALDDVVHFLGSRRDIPQILTAADYFVLPSLWEGLPMALLEAMASGLPCIATTVSGSEQAVLPGVTGLLVPPGDATAFGNAMQQLLSDPELSKRMGKAGRHRIESKFSAATQAAAHIELFAAGSRT